MSYQRAQSGWRGDQTLTEQVADKWRSKSAAVTVGKIHGLYGERYAYRESGTDVMIHHLMTEEKGKLPIHPHYHYRNVSSC